MNSSRLVHEAQQQLADLQLEGESESVSWRRLPGPSPDTLSKLRDVLQELISRASLKPDPDTPIRCTRVKPLSF